MSAEKERFPENWKRWLWPQGHRRGWINCLFLTVSHSRQTTQTCQHLNRCCKETFRNIILQYKWKLLQNDWPPTSYARLILLVFAEASILDIWLLIIYKFIWERCVFAEWRKALNNRLRGTFFPWLNSDLICLIKFDEFLDMVFTWWTRGEKKNIYRLIRWFCTSAWLCVNKQCSF